MTVTKEPPAVPVLNRVKGQPEVVRLLNGSLRKPVHAYLFLGPPGNGRFEAAVAFAAALMCPNGGCGECASCQEALAVRHPDLDVVERAAATILVSQAQAIGLMALRTPRVAPYHVLVLVDFELADKAVPVLLKTIEEPPDTTVIIVIAETIPPSFATIASRCVKVQFRPIDEKAIVDALVAEGAEVAAATAVAAVAGGRLDRARLLVRDTGFAERLRAWRTVPSRLDGTGARIVELAEELLASIEGPLEVLRSRQADEIASLKEEAASRGEKVIAGREAVETRHRRELRRVRTDEIRAGLVALSAVYRERLVAPEVSTLRLKTTLGAMAAIDEASSRLSRNVNETMLLEWLLLKLDT
jgi:DNA polymerase-3 subunit delta'